MFQQTLNQKGSASKHFTRESYEVVSSITDINFEHLSCMQVLSDNRIVLGGRWFGIYNCEFDASDNTIVTKKKLVDDSRFFWIDPRFPPYFVLTIAQ